MDLLLSPERDGFSFRPFRRRRVCQDSTAREISRVLKILKELDIDSIWMDEFCRQRDLNLNVNDVLRNMVDLCSKECSHFIDKSLVWATTWQGRQFWSTKDSEFTRLYQEKYGKKHNMFEW